jgi:hypothetical protein
VEKWSKERRKQILGSCQLSVPRGGEPFRFPFGLREGLLNLVSVSLPDKDNRQDAISQ